jgi:hypothetical protein
MATRESRSAAGRKRGGQLTRTLLAQLHHARTVSSLSLREVAKELGWSHERYRRFEGGVAATSVVDLASAGAVLGLGMSVAFRERERDGGVDGILLVLSASAHNRRVLPGLFEALGPGFAASPRAVLGALRGGRPIPGSAVILL